MGVYAVFREANHARFRNIEREPKDYSRNYKKVPLLAPAPLFRPISEVQDPFCYSLSKTHENPTS